MGNAIEVPGLGELNSGGHAGLEAISCAAPGDCAMGGAYSTAHNLHAFVVSETNGSWGNAMEVPGVATADPDSFVYSVSCGAPGDCAAVGGSSAGPGDYSQPFVVSETNGTWGTSMEVPGLAKIKTRGEAALNSVSCAAAGECAAGGYYRARKGSSRPFEPFVVSETNGSWDTAITVPGMSRLHHTGSAGIDSISCAAAGECAAGGHYRGRHFLQQVFVVDEKNGKWQKAITVPGTTKLNTWGHAEMDSISCAAAGKCAAAGFYTRPTHGHTAPKTKPFVVNEKNGRWRNAIAVRGSATLSGASGYLSISCAAPGACSAAGYVDVANYSPKYPDPSAFLLSEKHGIWGRANQLRDPGAG